MSASPPERRPDIDALRVGAVYLLVLFHVAKVYDPRFFFHIWSADLIPGMQHVTGFISLWHMPLLFFLAGWSAVSSLRGREPGAFARERMRRIALPLFFGCVFLCPVIKYLELRNGVSLGIGGFKATAALQEAHGALQTHPVPVMEPYTASFVEFLPRFFTSLKVFTWSHLWFLAYLLVMTSLATPFLVRAARAAARPAHRPVLWLLLPGLALLAADSVLRPYWPSTRALINDWASLAQYVIYFGMGAVWARYGELGERMRRGWLLALAASLVLYGAHMALGLVAAGMLAPLSPGARLIEYGIPAMVGWFFSLSLIGAAARFVTRPGPRLTALAGTVLPVYIVHLPVLVVAAYFLDRLPLPVGLRFALVFLVSFAVTLVIVLGPVRRFDLLRAGFGLQTDGPAAWHALALAVFAVAAALSLRAL